MTEEAYPAADIAAELRRRLPGIGFKKLHKLLYYCQGHHLADVGQALFDESIAAWDMGPVVGTLWKREQEGPAASTHEELDQAALNTIGYVVSRYGGLTGRDLEILSHGEPPWVLARKQGQATSERSPKLSHTVMTDFFRSAEGDDDPIPSAVGLSGVVEVLRGADRRAAQPARPDDLDRLRKRLADLVVARSGL